MAVQQDHTKYSQFNPQGLMRTSFGMFTDAGLNTYPSGPNQIPTDWLDLTNILPSKSGGFRRRWGLNTMYTETATPFNGVRMWPYNVAQDSPNSIAQEDLVILTDNQHFKTLSVTSTSAVSPLTNTLVFAPFGGHGPSNFANTGNVGAVVSREWFYYCNGTNTPLKVCPSYTAADTNWNWGIVSPYAFDSSTPTITAFGGVGQGYTSAPTVTITDTGTGATGSGATATATVNANGSITGFTVTDPGKDYTNPVVSFSGGGGTGAAAVAVIGTNGFGNPGLIVAVLPVGPIILNAGRIYTYAWQNTITGHTSDISNGINSGGSRQPYIGTTATIPGPAVGILGAVPANVGWENIFVTINPVTPIDVQIGSLILLATSDGGSVQTLYQVGELAITTTSPGTLTFTDTLPDTYNDNYIAGQTLLNQNLWADVDSFGNSFGIINNTPPPTNLLYPTLHQGRMFATDGKNLFFSKSLSDVTTATGLITSKWEEAWPGTNVLPIGLDNETITGLRSSGQNLHIATEKSIYELQGTDPTNFSIPSSLFQQTGIFGNDLWTVVYSQGQPLGYAWITPDLKMIYSDFNTYDDVSLPVYTYLSQWSNAFTQFAKLTSFTYGPYNFVVLCFERASSAEFLIFETVMQKWYHWTVAAANSGPLVSFVYEHPETGYRGLFYQETNSSQNLLRLFDPTFTTDNGNVINWSAQTSWTSLSDPLAFKTINELEVISEEASLRVSIYGAQTQSQFDQQTIPSSGTYLGTRSLVTSPLGPLKTYWAGAPTNARYYSFQFSSFLSGTAVSSPVEVLSHFIVEHFPMVRF